MVKYLQNHYPYPAFNSLSKWFIRQCNQWFKPSFVICPFNNFIQNQDNTSKKRKLKKIEALGLPYYCITYEHV